MSVFLSFPEPFLFMNLDLLDPYTQLVVTDVESFTDSPAEFVTTVEPNIVSTIECCVKPVRYFTDRHSDGFINGMNGNNYFRYGAFSFPRHLKALYVIKDVITGKWYVGSTQDLGARLTKHLSLLKLGTHPNTGLLDLWNDVQQGGSTNLIIKFITFPFSITMEVLRDLEQEVLDIHANNPDKLNIALDSRASQTGLHISNAHRAAIGTREITEEYREKLSAAGKLRENVRRPNRWLSIDGELYHSLTIAERKLKMAKSSIRHRCLSALHPTWFFLEDDDPRNTGPVSYKATDEHKANLSLVNRGKVKGDAHKAKIAAALKGRAPSEATRAAVVKAKSKAVTIDGVRYPSVSEASRILGIGTSTLDFRLKNPNCPTYQYI